MQRESGERLIQLLTELESSLLKLEKGKESRETLEELNRKATELLKETSILLEKLLEKKLPEKLRTYFGKDYGEFLRSLRSEENFKEFLSLWLLKGGEREIPFKELEERGVRYKIELKELFLAKELKELKKELTKKRNLKGEGK